MLLLNVLIVESVDALSHLWKRHIERFGARVHVAPSQDVAFELLAEQGFDVIILDLVLDHGSAFAVADLAQYRHPDTRIIFVTSTNFFSDGSIFNLCANACAFLPSATPPEDLAAMVQHYGRPITRQTVS